MTRLTYAHSVKPPASSAIAGWYPHADLLDSFAIQLPPDAPRDPRALAELVLLQQPAAVRRLMSVRDFVMAKAGVATSADIRRTADGKDRIGFFPVLSSTPSEIVVGYNDRHLDFRTSIAVIEDPGGDLLAATTAVRCHNLLGRLYLFTIRPFHVAIVRSGLRRVREKKQGARS